jgi:hypothetical protein
MKDLIDICDQLNTVKIRAAVIHRAIGATAHAVDKDAITGLELLAFQIADDIAACIGHIEAIIKGERNEQD